MRTIGRVQNKGGSGGESVGEVVGLKVDLWMKLV